MAKLVGPIQITGNVGGLSHYKMQGVEGIVVRKGGGANKKRINKSPEFANTRRLNNEWRGCTAMGVYFRRALNEMVLLADYNLTGSVNAMMKQVQARDEESEWGKRMVKLSAYRYVLSGYGFNKYNHLESLLKIMPKWSIDRANGSAHLSLLEFDPSRQVNNFRNHPYFRLVATLGVVPDMVFDSKLKAYRPTVEVRKRSVSFFSEWESVRKEQLSFPKIELQIESIDLPVDDSLTFMLAFGIEFGTPDLFGRPVSVKYASAARILGAE